MTARPVSVYRTQRAAYTALFAVGALLVIAGLTVSFVTENLWYMTMLILGYPTMWTCGSRYAATLRPQQNAAP